MLYSLGRDRRFGNNFAKELQFIPLLNDTVACRKENIAEDVEQRPFDKHDCRYAEIESRFVAKDDVVPFLWTRDTAGGVDAWLSRAAHAMSTTMSFSQASLYGLIRHRGDLVKMLPVPGWRLMKQLALCVHSYDAAVFSTTGLSSAS
ncbi:hypothetical protein TNCV_4188921 [Trichonephila clavipes]|nr:hypothetical protein TNCV_4188921 [Trichonephila clavipes]